MWKQNMRILFMVKELNIISNLRELILFIIIGLYL